MSKSVVERVSSVLVWIRDGYKIGMELEYPFLFSLFLSPSHFVFRLCGQINSLEPRTYPMTTTKVKWGVGVNEKWGKKFLN